LLKNITLREHWVRVSQAIVKAVQKAGVRGKSNSFQQRPSFYFLDDLAAAIAQKHKEHDFT